MSNFITSDWHFGHVNILTYCNRHRYLGLDQDADVTDMNEALVELWNSQVEKNDLVLCVGDMCMGKVAETLEYVKRLKGHKILIPGNHDRFHPVMYKSEVKTAEWLGLYSDAGFDCLDPGPYTWEVDGIQADFSHFPYGGDHTEEERYTQYRPIDRGLPLCHGHVHDLYQTRNQMFNVGIDAWNGRMITPEEIGEYFRSIGF